MSLRRRWRADEWALTLATLAGSLLSFAACQAPAPGDAGAGGSDAGRSDAGRSCPEVGISGSGVHRLFVQGHDAPPLPDGRWPLLHQRAADGGDAPLCDDEIFAVDESGDGLWQPGEELHPLGPDALVHGEHFLVGVGSFVELSATLCDDITGRITLYIPNYDEEGSVALHQLFVVHQGVETFIAEATDDEPGTFGYNPFVRVLEGEDPEAVPGDTLLLRSTNISGVPFSVMVWRPPSEYESWILVEVP